MREADLDPVPLSSRNFLVDSVAMCADWGMTASDSLSVGRANKVLLHGLVAGGFSNLIIINYAVRHY